MRKGELEMYSATAATDASDRPMLTGLLNHYRRKKCQYSAQWLALARRSKTHGGSGGVVTRRLLSILRSRKTVQIEHDIHATSISPAKHLVDLRLVDGGVVQVRLVASSRNPSPVSGGNAKVIDTCCARGTASARDPL